MITSGCLVKTTGAETSSAGLEANSGSYLAKRIEKIDRPLAAAVEQPKSDRLLALLQIDIYLLSGGTMRTTLNIDDELLGEAQRISGMTEKAALVRGGLVV